MGGLPLALGTGTGSELRRPLGIAIVGGLIFSQMLTLYTTPVVYLYLDRFRLWVARMRGVKDHARRVSLTQLKHDRSNRVMAIWFELPEDIEQQLRHDMPATVLTGKTPVPDSVAENEPDVVSCIENK